MRGMNIHHSSARLVILMAAVAGTLAVAACGSTASSPTPTQQTRPGGVVFDVTQYGAKGDGTTDNTSSFARAIAAAQSAVGGTVYVPAGHFIFTMAATPNPGSIVIQGPSPVTLMGAGRDSTSLIEGRTNKGLLGVRSDKSVVEDITLDTKTHDGGPAIYVQANHTRLLRARVLGGTRHFALYYAGPHGATPTQPTYNVGNAVSDLDLNELDCNDGFSWSFQQDSTISDVTHTGSRLALYVDQTTTVTNYRYTPGAQQCSARNGFWLTPPAKSITITNFTSSGEGGKIAVIAAKGVGKLATDVTIRSLTMTGTGQTVTIGDVRNLVLDDCSLGSNDIVVKAQGSAQGIVSHCTYGQVLQSSVATAQVSLSISRG